MNDEPPALPAPTTAALVQVVAPPAIAILLAQARDDAHLVALWLHGRSPATQRAYAADLAAFRALVPAPLRQVTLGDFKAYQDNLAALASTTQARRLSTLKSLLSFGHNRLPRRQCRRGDPPAARPADLVGTHPRR